MRGCAALWLNNTRFGGFWYSGAIFLLAILVNENRIDPYERLQVIPTSVHSQLDEIYGS